MPVPREYSDRHWSHHTRRSFLGTAAAAATTTAGCLGIDDGESLVIGILPDVDPDTAVEQNVPLADHLENEIGVEIELQTTSDYASLVQSMVAENVDVAYFGGVSYVLANERADARAIAVAEQNGMTEWTSVFIAHTGTGIETGGELAESENVEFVLGDPLSTTGSVMPTYYAHEELGIDIEEEFASSTHIGAHDAVLRTVSNGDADAGALNSRIFDARHSDEYAEGATEIWRTPSFPNYPWAVGPTVSDELAVELQSAFLSLHEQVPQETLDRLNVDRYVEATPSDFTDLEDAVEFVGITDS